MQHDICGPIVMSNLCVFRVYGQVGAMLVKIQNFLKN